MPTGRIYGQGNGAFLELSQSPRTLPARCLDCSGSSADEVQDQGNHRKNEQDVNQCAGNVKYAKTKKPGQNQNNEQNGEDAHSLLETA